MQNDPSYKKSLELPYISRANPIEIIQIDD